MNEFGRRDARLVDSARGPYPPSYAAYNALYDQFDGLRLHFLHPDLIPVVVTRMAEDPAAEATKEFTIPRFCNISDNPEDDEKHRLNQFYLARWHDLMAVIEELAASDYVHQRSKRMRVVADVRNNVTGETFANVDITASACLPPHFSFSRDDQGRMKRTFVKDPVVTEHYRRALMEVVLERDPEPSLDKKNKTD